MYKTIYPTKDATLYSRHPERNTGTDQILELNKVASGSAIEDLIGQYEYWSTTQNSRILLDFDITDISSSISDGTITNPKFYLTLRATEAINLPINYEVKAYPVSGSWTNGTGFYNNDAQITDGVSWKYRFGSGDGRQWSELGGDFYSSSAYEGSQTFNYNLPDVRMEVTNIVNAWVSGALDQHGFMVKFSEELETNSTDVGSIKFFSKDTHTVYLPRLEAYWDDTDVSGTGSISEISGEDYVIYAKNLKESYLEGETPKIRFGVRQKFPTRTYSTSSAYTGTNRLPFNSYYQITDSMTEEVIIPFHEDGTRISCDSTGNYIRLDINSFMPERFYKIVIKVETDGGDTVNYVDDRMYFKVERL